MTAVLHELALFEGRNLLPVKIDFTAAYGVHAAEHVQKCGFSGTGGTKQNTEFSFINSEGNILECVDPCISGSVALCDILKLDIVLIHSFLPFYSVEKT